MRLLLEDAVSLALSKYVLARHWLAAPFSGLEMRIQWIFSTGDRWHLKSKGKKCGEAVIWS